MHRKALFRWFPSMKVPRAPPACHQGLVVTAAPSFPRCSPGCPDVSKSLQRGVHQSLHVRRLRDIRLHRDGPRPLSSSPPDDLFAPRLRSWPWPRDHRRPFGRQGFGLARPSPLLPPVTMATRSFNPRSMATPSNAKWKTDNRQRSNGRNRVTGSQISIVSFQSN